MRHAREVNGNNAGAAEDVDLPKGILDSRPLPYDHFDELWDSVIMESQIKDRLLSQAVLNFTVRGKFDRARVPLHGVLLLAGPPGTGKTSLGRGLASKTARAFHGAKFHYLEVEPHALASNALGKSQQAVSHLLGTVVAEQAAYGPVIVLLDEVETLAADRSKLSLEANPVDVHRATDALLAQLDHLAAKFPELLFVATSNFPKAIDGAFLSRVDQIVTVDLPNEEACQLIVVDTLKALGEQFGDIKSLIHSHGAASLGKHCFGLDGRQIRKAVLSALTLDKRTAADPNRLTLRDLHTSFEDAKSSKKL